MFDKKELFNLPIEARRELASDLIDSILADEMEVVPNWKKKLINERIRYHNEHPGNGLGWNELKKKYGR